MNKLRKAIKRIAVACFAVLIVTGTSKVVKAYAADLSVIIDTGESVESVILEDTDGDGAYEISNANKLYAFAAAVNGGNTAINGELTANITVNTGVLVDGELANDTSGFREWTPIGNLKNEYTGTFNGNNKTVFGLYFNNSSSDYVGLFGYVSGGTIQKVGVVDSYFKGGDNVGGVVGTNSGTIKNCYNTGTVRGVDNVGGVAGINYGTIENCYNEGTVRSSEYFAGGVVGTNRGTITDCYNTGTISGISSFGDVVGSNLNTIKNCYYLVGNETDYVADGTTAKNAEQFTSGEVAYLLGEAWGQILEGENRQSSPVPGGKRVYETSNCQGDIIYSNIEGQSGVHSYEDGYCTLCDSFETPAGSGTAESPYLIDNAGKLYWFASQVNGGSKSIHGKLTENIVVNQNVLMADGTLNEGTFRKWIPIGNSTDKYYTGIFDGNGKTVSGLYFNNSDTNYVGLFGKVCDGTIKNVGVVGSYFRGSEYVGGVVGYNNPGTVENCYNTGSINGTRRVGGVVGYNNDTVKNCHNTGEVSGNQYVGSVVGDNTKTVTKCYYLADSETDEINGTTAKTAAQFASGEVAYLLGEAWGQILEGENCQKFPVLDGESVYPVYNCKNEIVDYSNIEQPTLHSTYNNGFCTSCDSCEIPKGSGTKESPYLIDNAGNLYWFAARVNDGNNSIHGKLTADIVVNEYVLAEMAKETPDVSDFREWTPIGKNMTAKYSGTFNGNGNTVSGLYFNDSSIYHVGLFGYVQSGTVQKVGVVDSYFSGDDNVGGVVGDLMTGTVENCYNTGTVSGNSDVGGLVGQNTGTVKNCYNTGTVIGGSNVGGVVGQSAEKINNCYNTGNVSGSSNVGEVVGYNTDTVTNCYYLAESETDAINGISAKTMAQFSSGEVAYLLNGTVTNGTWNAGPTNGTQSWYQTIGTDNYPVTNIDHGTVYSVFTCDGKTTLYSNVNENEPHTDDTGDGYCDVCGNIYDGIGVHLAGYNVSLNGSIGVNFYMDLTQNVLNDVGAYMLFTLANGTTQKVMVSDAKANGSEVVNNKTYYIFTCNVAAKEMTDTIQARLFTSDGSKTQIYYYSVSEYANRILTGNFTASTKKLVEAMLVYGACSQSFFGYQEDVPAIELDKDIQTELDTITEETLAEYRVNASKVSGLGTFAGAKLVLESDTTLKVYFAPEEGVTLESLTFKVGDSTKTKTKSGSYYVIEIPNITAKQLDKTYNITVTNGKISGDFECSVFAYGYSVLSDTTGSFTEELKNTIKALYLYNKAAKAHSGN